MKQGQLVRVLDNHSPCNNFILSIISRVPDSEYYISEVVDGSLNIGWDRSYGPVPPDYTPLFSNRYWNVLPDECTIQEEVYLIY